MRRSGVTMSDRLRLMGREYAAESLRYPASSALSPRSLSQRKVRQDTVSGLGPPYYKMPNQFGARFRALTMGNH